LGTSSFANPSTARPSASSQGWHKLHLWVTSPSPGRPGWQPQTRQTRRVGTAFLLVRSCTALVCVWRNQFSEPGPVIQADRSPVASQIKNRRDAPSRSETTPLLLRRVQRSPQGPPRTLLSTTTSGSSASSGLARWSNETPTPPGFNGPTLGGLAGTVSQVHRPRTGPAWNNALSVAPGSTVLAWPAPHGSSSYYLGFIGYAMDRHS
jgi:hypothetical protein